MFSAFLGGTEEINRIETNLAGSTKPKIKGLIQQLKEQRSKLIKDADDCKSTIDIINSEIKNGEDLQKKNSGLSEIILAYPNFYLFKGEKSAQEIDELADTKQKNVSLNNQLYILKELAIISKYKDAYYKINNYLNVLKDVIDLSNFDTHIGQFYNQKKELVQQTANKIEDNLLKQKKELEGIRNKLNSRFDLGIDYLKYLKSVSDLIYLENVVELKRFMHKIDKLEKDLKDVNKLEERLLAFSSVDKALVALRATVDNIEGFKQYRKDNHNCPLCGSAELFSDEKIELGIVAKKALGTIDEERANCNQKLRLLNTKVNNTISDIKGNLLTEIANIVTSIEEDLLAFAEVLPFKNACTKWEIDFNSITAEIITNTRNSLWQKCKEEKEILALESEILNLLTDESGILYNCPSPLIPTESITKTEFERFNILNKEKVLRQFKLNFELRLSKIIIIVEVKTLDTSGINLRTEILEKIKLGVETNSELQSKRKTLLEKTSSQKMIEQQLAQNQRMLVKMNSFLIDIKTIRTDWERNVADQINEPLNYVYKRINRHNNYERLVFQKPDRGKSKNVEFDIQDTSGNKMFVPNVVSAGQLSTIAIASFLTIAMGQKDLPFRCYFMDDPIQSMDDINVLSFIDLLRIELSAGNKFIDQLFISTCNEDMEALILHKMKHFNVSTSHFRFNGYGSFL